MRSRIVGVVVAAVLVAVAAGLLGVTALASATDRTRAMYEQHTVGVQLALEARYQYSTYRFAEPQPRLGADARHRRSVPGAARRGPGGAAGRARGPAGPRRRRRQRAGRRRAGPGRRDVLRRSSPRSSSSWRPTVASSSSTSSGSRRSVRSAAGCSTPSTGWRPPCRRRPGRASRTRPTPSSGRGRRSSPWWVPAGCWPCWAVPSSRTGSAGTSPACGGRRSAWPTATSPAPPGCCSATTSAGRRPRSTRRWPPSARW